MLCGAGEELCSRCVVQQPIFSPPCILSVCLSVCLCVYVRSPIQKNYGCNHMTCSKVSGGGVMWKLCR